MPGIDTIFDLAEAGLDAFGDLSGVARDEDRAAPARDLPARASSPVTSSRASRGYPVTVATPSSSRALARVGYRIEDVTDAETGRTAYVVTDGRDRAECNSRAFAERVRAALA